MSAAYNASYGYFGGATAAQPAAPPASMYGEQRPTFSEDGTGTPYSTLLNMVGSAALNQDVSYDTSSKDPLMIRSRVFIGNIARAIITRDDIIELFSPFGKVHAVNYFAQQGFGFVQFFDAAEADKSCLTLNGKQWKGCALDVHLAMLGAMKKPGPPVQPVPAVPVVEPFAQQSLKRPAIEDEDYEVFKQNKKNKTFANSDKTINEQLIPNEMCDTLICGNCRFVTSDFEEYKEHRVAGCDKYRDPEEPSHRLKCATCSQRFLGAWGLLEHLTEFHRMLLYNEEPLTKAELERMKNDGAAAGASADPAKSGQTSSTATPVYNIVEGAPVMYPSNSTPSN